MARYLKKPVTLVDAMRYAGDPATLAAWVRRMARREAAAQQIRRGDWLVRRADGAFSVLSDAEFRESYVSIPRATK